MNNQFDLCVIGAGPAGYAAAVRALDFGKRVLLVEKGKLGGAGVFDGALSSKTLWEISTQVAEFNIHAEKYGCGKSTITWDEVLEEMNGATEERRKQLAENLDCLSNQLHPGKLHLLKGSASLQGPHQIAVQTATGTENYHAEQIILATGSRPRLLPDIPIDEHTILTSDGIGNLKQFPESMVILGAGVIGCEFATIFSGFGHTKVYLIDKAPRILPFEDADLSAVVEANLEKRGVTIHRGAKLLRMGIDDGMVEYELGFEDGPTEVHRVEKALISVGRVPNTETLNLRAAGLTPDARGYIQDVETQTSVPHIYAVGDITCDLALVNVGELEGRHAVERMFSKPERPLCHDNISTIMFLCPEVAGVGMNEMQAKQAGIPYRVATICYDCIPRAIAMRQEQGFFKILVTDNDEMKLLGMRAVGVHASTAIQAVALLIYMGKGIRELAELTHPHPSIIEGIQECVRMLLGTSILKPEVFPHDLACRKWAP